MTEDETDLVNYFICASVLNILRPDEVYQFIEEGICTYFHDVYNVYNNAIEILPLICNDACLVRKLMVHFDA